jgi:sugar phosphate isomerase/epimerase
VKLAADAGFAGADVDLGWGGANSAEALRDLFESQGLRYGGWGLPFDWRDDDDNAHHEGLTQLKQQAETAEQLGIDSCCTWIMPSARRPMKDNWTWHVQRLTAPARILADRGLRLGLEFVAPYHLRRHLPHEFIFTPGQMLELASDIGPNVGLLVDSFHCHASGTPWEQIETLSASRIVLAHVNDAPQGSIHQLQDMHRLLPGEGMLDLRAFLGALQKAGYNGPVSVEVFSDELKRLPPPDAARRAYVATQKCLQGALLE